MLTIVVIFVGVFICWIAYKNDTLYFKNYLNYWYKSFDFKGTIKRKDYWITQAWCLILLIFLILIGLSIFYDLGYYEGYEKNCFNPDCYPERLNTYKFVRYKLGDLNSSILIPFYSWVIVSFIPSVSIQIRRLRDAAKNPLWFLICFVPFIGGIVLLIFYLSPSRKKRLPMTLQDRLSEVEDLLTKGTIDEEEYKYMRKQILSKHID